MCRREHHIEAQEMKYFVSKAELSGTCYHEFAMGKWDCETFWREDSIYLHDNVLYEHAGFTEAVSKVIPEYSPYGEVTITSAQWQMIGRSIEHYDTATVELYHEADQWATAAFENHNVITILGI